MRDFDLPQQLFDESPCHPICDQITVVLTVMSVSGINNKRA